MLESFARIGLYYPVHLKIRGDLLYLCPIKKKFKFIIDQKDELNQVVTLLENLLWRNVVSVTYLSCS